MRKLISYFFSEYNGKQQTIWFKRLLYLFVASECIYFLFQYDLLFGEHSIVTVKPAHTGFFKDLPFLLYQSHSIEPASYFLLSSLIICIVQLVLRRSYILPDLLLWLMVLNLNNRIYPALTGGDNLLNQFLFFNCFLSSTFSSVTKHSELKKCIHNFAFVALLIQVCLLYFVSALAKLNDSGWLHGTAVASVSQIRHFSLFAFLNYSEALNPVFVVLNYLVLCYQLLFPILVWIKGIKKPLLITGILMHLYIAFVMGLPGFGIIMIMAYVLFWPSKQQVS